MWSQKKVRVGGGGGGAAGQTHNHSNRTTLPTPALTSPSWPSLGEAVARGSRAGGVVAPHRTAWPGLSSALLQGSGLLCQSCAVHHTHKNKFCTIYSFLTNN